MSVLGKIIDLKKKLDGVIVNHQDSLPRKSLRTIRRKMIFARTLCGIGYSAFFHYHCERASYRWLFKVMLAKHFCGMDVSGLFLYHCENASLCQISRIVRFDEQEELWLQVNPAESRIILNDKYKTYLLFKEHYQRDVVFVSDKDNKDEFLSFCQSHSCYIVKPLSEASGKGVQLINTNEASFSVDDYLDSYPDGFVAEELIKQGDVLSQLHPESVNTLRINTANYGSSIEVIWPCLRMGCGESIVDNAGAGGVFGAIDVTTGAIIGVSDEHTHTFTKHPDTKIPLIGFSVPMWREACEMAKHLASLIPDCRFIGWDLALTDKGWVMVEGNSRPLIIWQLATGEGIRKEFKKLKKRLLQK